MLDSSKELHSLLLEKYYAASPAPWTDRGEAPISFQELVEDAKCRLLKAMLGRQAFHIRQQARLKSYCRKVCPQELYPTMSEFPI